MRYLIALTLSVYMAFQPAFATLNEVDKTNIFSKNMLKNGGFENGKASWTASAGTFAVTTSSPMVGLQHATWDAAASADTLTSGDITIPAGFFARNGVASCVFTTASGTATHEIQVWDGASVLSEATITSSTNPTRTSVNFIYPSSSSVAVRIYANADEPSVAIDDCYLGPAEGYNVSSVSQATFVGESYFLGTSGCNWARTSATIGAFTTDASCPGPTILTSTLGTWATTDVDLPEQTITNLPPGIYEATFIFNANSSVVSNIAYAINDGTTTCNAVGGSTATTPAGHVVTCSFTYTTAGTRNFELYAASNASTANLNGDVTSPQQHIRFILKRFPLSSEQAYTPDLQAMSWSGYHTSTCSWTFTGAVGDLTGDATCSLTEIKNQGMGSVTTSLDGSNARPGIKITAKAVGIVYDICAVIGHDNSAAGQVNTFNLTDATDSYYGEVQQPVNAYQNTTTVCGQFTSTSVTSAMDVRIKAGVTGGTGGINGTNMAVSWTVKALHRPIPAPVLTNMVSTSVSGGIKIESARLNCDSGSAITEQLGSWVSSIGNISSGACAVTLTSGTFSASPICQATINADPGAYGGSTISAVASSATSVSVDCQLSGGACTSWDLSLTCFGAR